jgi:hypothetical protein
MNYGGGGGGGGGGGMPPFGGGVPPYGSAVPPYGTATPGYPVFGMPMQPMAPGGIPVPQAQGPPPASGQGPLGEAPARRGANGLLQAPEAEGPEGHEAEEFIKLNPGEAVKYDEHWAEACAGEDKVSGADARAVLGRAARVSKTQLRLIWEIADHRREGELDRPQFLIALRLIALAQRGAEISVKGLRNFVGIHLVPDIAPAPQAAPPAPASPVQSAAAGQPAAAFSWTVAPDVVLRYDNFFTSLDVPPSGFIDGRTGAAFFGRSGLPRPTLKRVWQLADVTRDGRLDRDEFRSAMHMVANLRTGRIAVGDLPAALDPAGPHWLRSEQEVQLMQQQQQQQQQQHTPSPVQSPRAAPPGQTATDGGGPVHPAPPPPRGPLQEVRDGDLLGGAVPVRHGSPGSRSGPPASPRVAGDGSGESADALREKLRLEQHEAARTQRELEAMRAEMEHLRLEKTSASSASRQQQRQDSEVEEMRRAYQSMLEAKARAEEEAAQARSEALKLKEQAAAAARLSSPPPAPAAPVPARSAGGGLGDDIWDEPSPKAARRSSTAKAQPVSPVPPSSAQPPTTGRSPASASRRRAAGPPVTPTAPVAATAGAKATSPSIPRMPPLPASSQARNAANGKAPAGDAAKRATRLVSDDSVSESDEDDFWGSAGSGAKPTLGAPANASGGAGARSASGGGFGNDLDEWAF